MRAEGSRHKVPKFRLQPWDLGLQLVEFKFPGFALRTLVKVFGLPHGSVFTYIYIYIYICTRVEFM